MRLEKYKVEEHNQSLLAGHRRKLEFLSANMASAAGERTGSRCDHCRS